VCGLKGYIGIPIFPASFPLLVVDRRSGREPSTRVPYYFHESRAASASSFKARADEPLHQKTRRNELARQLHAKCFFRKARHQAIEKRSLSRKAHLARPLSMAHRWEDSARMTSEKNPPTGQSSGSKSPTVGFLSRGFAGLRQTSRRRRRRIFSTMSIARLVWRYARQAHAPFRGCHPVTAHGPIDKL
jgi:hypothetical protein